MVNKSKEITPQTRCLARPKCLFGSTSHAGKDRVMKLNAPG